MLSGGRCSLYMWALLAELLIRSEFPRMVKKLHLREKDAEIEYFDPTGPRMRFF